MLRNPQATQNMLSSHAQATAVMAREHGHAVAEQVCLTVVILCTKADLTPSAIEVLSDIVAQWGQILAPKQGVVTEAGKAAGGQVHDA